MYPSFLTENKLRYYSCTIYYHKTPAEVLIYIKSYLIPQKDADKRQFILYICLKVNMLQLI
jgi:hypothetical protein